MSENPYHSHTTLTYLVLRPHPKLIHAMKFTATALLIASVASATATTFDSNVHDREIYEAKVSQLVFAFAPDTRKPC